jgi:enoyl-CoA hydratase/carnithine racemase
MGDDDVLFEEADGIATITLNRPEARNALSVAAANRLHELWEAVDGSASVRAVILTSADCGTFCAGMDLKEAARIKREHGKDVLTLIKDPMHQRMRRVRQPIVAAMPPPPACCCRSMPRG